MSADPRQPATHHQHGGPVTCPHCGKHPSIEDIQNGRCPDTGELLDPFELGVAGDLHGDEMPAVLPRKDRP